MPSTQPKPKTCPISLIQPCTRPKCGVWKYTKTSFSLFLFARFLAKLKREIDKGDAIKTFFSLSLGVIGLFRAAKWKLKMAQFESECSRNEESRFDVVVFAVHHNRYFVPNWRKIYNCSAVHSRGRHNIEKENFFDWTWFIFNAHLSDTASHQPPSPSTVNYDYQAKIKKLKNVLSHAV